MWGFDRNNLRLPLAVLSVAAWAIRSEQGEGLLLGEMAFFAILAVG